MSAFDPRDNWMDYAFSMADDAGRGSKDLSLIATRLEGLSLDSSVADRLRAATLRWSALTEEEASRASRSLFGELARWLLEFMVAASYVRQERGMLEEELAVAVGRWFSRLGTELSESERAGLTNAILVKSFLNDARPFMVARTSGNKATLVEAPLLLRIEHGRYRVTDEAENYLYHLDSTIDSFASDYSLVAARMGRELESRSYGKSSHTVMEMIATVGHVRLLMSTLVNETGRIGPDEQAERYEAIRQSVEEIRKSDEVERRYQREVNHIWEGWSESDAARHMRETKADRLADLRSLGEGLRILMAVKSWMYDEYATLSERCEEVTRHYLRSSIVTTLFSLDALIDEVKRADLVDVGWLDKLLLPATKPEPSIGFPMPPMITLDGMFSRVEEAETHEAVDLGALIDAGEEDQADDDEGAVALARAFAAWLADGGGTLEEWLAERSPEQLFAEMESYDLARLVSSLLADTGSRAGDDVGAARQPGDAAGAAGYDARTSGQPGDEAGAADPDADAAGYVAPDPVAEGGRITSFADASWLAQVLPAGAAGLRVVTHKTGDEVSYLGSTDEQDVHGTLENLRFEVTIDA